MCFIPIYLIESRDSEEVEEAAKDMAPSLPFLFRIFLSGKGRMKIPKRPICSMHRVLKSLLHLPKGSIASHPDWKAFISLHFRHVSLARFNERIFTVIFTSSFYKKLLIIYADFLIR